MRTDPWESGPAYERYMGRWSRLVAARFTEWLAPPEGLSWLDVGCGTGALSTAVAEGCRPRTLLGVDRSEPFVRAATLTVGGGARTAFAVADAMALPVRDASCDVAVSGLTLNFLPEPAAGAAELVRAVRPGGGTVAAYVWDYGDGMAFLRHFWDAVATVDPAAAVALDEGRRFALCRPERLHSLWTEAGLTAVTTAPIDVRTVFADFADLWDPFLAGQGPAPGYVASLTPGDRDRLRTAYAESVPHEPDGSIDLTARAWAVRGVRRTSPARWTGQAGRSGRAW
ncbi:class I SAM-dependent methyltransferase [Streptomyces roseicoloratus]|uniref:class I SAM-dependent methyltransferase n=1 Tax=Streptomyces roseicoloratus TaxID=2508722 RepID=UPI001009F560|nr:methyltransferase domain-containing protein [Streptomyces roseicoloratus]